MATSVPATLLTLPRDIRLRILSLATAVCEAKLIFGTHDVRLHVTGSSASLCRTCRLLRQDVLCVLGRNHVLHICAGPRCSPVRTSHTAHMRLLTKTNRNLLIPAPYRESVRVVEVRKGATLPRALPELREAFRAVDRVFPALETVRLRLQVEYSLFEAWQVDEMSLQDLRGIVSSSKLRGAVQRMYRAVLDTLLNLPDRRFLLDIQLRMGHFHAIEWRDCEEGDAGEGFLDCASINACIIETESGIADITIAIGEDFHRWLAFRAEKISGEHEVLFQRVYDEPSEEQWEGGREKIWVKSLVDGKWSLGFAPVPDRSH